MAKNENKMTFESAMEELEGITAKLEKGNETLETSMQLYERGVELKAFCEKKLKEAEKKWTVLKKDKETEVIVQEELSL